MTAIAGIALPSAEEQVHEMLARMAYRGPKGKLVLAKSEVTVGLALTEGQPAAEKTLQQSGIVEDAVGDSQFSRAAAAGNTFVLSRDLLGAAPLYYGFTLSGALCFASEVKGLLGFVGQVHELPPGCICKDGKVQPQAGLAPQKPTEEAPLAIAAEVRRRIKQSVGQFINRGKPFGVWLSGGLDSSIIAALARPHVSTLHTFTAGFANSEDLEHAQLVSRYIKSSHHEYIPSMREIAKALPHVIYHLESFDTQLVRSSLMNYFTAKMTADYVPAVFSGEGSDELFAGDEDLKSLPLEALPEELIRRASQLHNTTLQRVDRCAAAFGLVPYIPFLDSGVVDYALTIPPEYKISNGLEKWILRRAVYDLLPERVLRRQKSRFWEGAGVRNRMADYAEEKVTDAEFSQMQPTSNGGLLPTKEAALYYRIFTEHFGQLEQATWMGFLQQPVNE